jgi:hypothetical protein
MRSVDTGAEKADMDEMDCAKERWRLGGADRFRKRIPKGARFDVSGCGGIHRNAFGRFC